MQEPEVTEEERGGVFGEVVIFHKGPVSVTLYYDQDAFDPREQFDYWSEEDVKAWEEGDVYSFLINYHDGELDSLSGLYGWEYAQEQALEGLDHAWERYEDDSRKVREWARSMGETLAGTYPPMEVPV